MIRFLFLVMALAMGIAGYAQKPKINKANSLRESGELAEAKEIIDAAIEYEKTKDNGKTWYYRGLIYATLDTITNEQFSGLSKNALEEAVKAFQMADSLGDEGKDYYITDSFGLPITKAQQVNGYFSYYYNNGVEAFQDGQYEEAVNSFSNAYFINPADTNACVNAAYAAHNGELYDLAKENYRKAIDAGANSVDLYYNYLNIITAIDKDNEEAIKLIDEALEVFPDDISLQKSRINAYLALEKNSEALSELEKAVGAEPDNPNLWFTLGILYEELGNKEKAIESYKGAMKVDPSHFESNYNYGVMLINEANDIIKERNNLGLSKADRKKADSMEPLIDEKLKKALPQWEKVYEIKPDDKQVLETLAYIYTQLGMSDKAKSIQAKIK